MSLRHYLALSYVADPGGISQQQLSEILCIDANNTVLLLNEMEDQGLIRRVRDPADRRRHLVEVTDHGRETLPARAARPRERRGRGPGRAHRPRAGHPAPAPGQGARGLAQRMRRYVVADVFTDVPLQGNQVAVFEDAQGLSAELMQRAARELNLSETVFVLAGRRRRRVRRAHPDLHPRDRAAVRRAPGAGHGVRRRRAPRPRRRSSAAPRPGSSRWRSSAATAPSCSARWSSRCRRGPRLIAPTSCSRRSAWSAPSCPSRSTTTARATPTCACPTRRPWPR